MASISTLVAQVSYDLVTIGYMVTGWPNITTQEEEKEWRRKAIARGGRKKEMPEERERMPTTGEMERLPNGRARPTLASGLQQQQSAAVEQQEEEAAAVKEEEESGGDVENMIATVQDLLRPA